jgi:hypothetical protein
VPLDLAAGDDRPAHRQQIFKQGRTAATKASDIDKLCQCRPSLGLPLEHDPDKWKLVSRKDHAQAKVERYRNSVSGESDLGLRQKEDVVDVTRVAVPGKPAGEPRPVLQIAKACGIDRSKNASVGQGARNISACA